MHSTQPVRSFALRLPLFAVTGGLLLLAACSPADDSPDPSPASGGSGAATSGGSSATGGSPATGTNGGSGGSPQTGSGGQPGVGGSTSGGTSGAGGLAGSPAGGGDSGATSTGGVSGSAGAPPGGSGGQADSGGQSGGGSGGADTGGQSGSGGQADSGGQSGGDSGGQVGTGGESGGGGTDAGGSGGSGGADPGGNPGVACPSSASFCSGFEEMGLPMGAVYKLNGDPATPWTHDFEIDTSVKKSGQSSLRVRTNSEASGAYKMLAVPTPGPTFWVRFYIRSDVDLGMNDHNVFAYAAGSDDPNDSKFVEFAEDVGIAFNSHDIVRWPMGYGRLQNGQTMPFTLPKDTWHCIEISFDGPGRRQRLFIDGMQMIEATDYPATAYTFTTFKFGYNALHGAVRKTWYDDVAVAPERIGCLE